MIARSIYGLLITRHVADDGFIELGFAGAFFERDVNRFRTDLIRQMAVPGTRGMVVDLRDVSLVFDDAAPVPPQLARAADAQLRARPVAIVVKPDAEALCLHWAWEMTCYGFTRRVFLDRDEARQWVRLRAGGRRSVANAAGAGFQTSRVA